MIVEDVFGDILLGLAAAVVLVSSVGILAMRDVYRKLHFLTPIALVAPVLVALAVFVHHGYYESTTETWLALFFLAVSGPFVTHAIIRAARIREKGDWRTGRGDGAPPSQEAGQ